MLTIQPAKVAFKGYDRSYLSQEEREYRRNYDDLKEQKEEFLNIADNEDFKIPKTAKKALKFGAVLTTALLGGMATGWGAKKSIQGFSKLSKSESVQSLKKYLLNAMDFVKKSAKTLKRNFIKSDVYKKPANLVKKNYEKFEETKIGKNIIKYAKKAGKGIAYVYKQISKAVKFVYDKIKGINREKAEKYAVNTFAVSGGIASGVSAVKEKQGEV